MKSTVVSLWCTVLSEAGALHSVRTNRDELYALSRIEHEGEAFLGITLPAFEKDLLEALDRGQVGSNHFCGFRRRGGLPTFLSGFLRRVFDNRGVLRVDADPAVVKTLRQVLLVASKIERPTSVEREIAAIEQYVACDAELAELSIDVELLRRFERWATALLGPFFTAVERRLYDGDFIPRHSSGAVAGRESYNARHNFRTWTERLQEVFPWWEDAGISPRQILDEGPPTVLAPEHEPPVRVVTVPKTMKGPRVISIEPVWMQFVQQGISKVMVETIQSPNHAKLNALCGWLSQEPNRELARLGSVDGGFATLDLSEASDRVSLQLVESLFTRHRFLRRCVLACRSSTALLPDGRTIRLNKFASMGSGLTFPIESVVFHVIVRMAIAEACGHDGPRLRCGSLCEETSRVYGDDLIVPRAAARPLRRLLEAFGLKVNARKSFTIGQFRESCGSDWFRGHDVSVFKQRAELPAEHHQHELTEKTVELHNRAYVAGWRRTASHLEAHVVRVQPRMQYVPVGTPVASLYTDDHGKIRYRINPHLQRLEAKAWLVRRVKPVDACDGWGALRKFFLPHGEPRERDHLERDGRSRVAGAKLGWVSVNI